MFFAGVHDPTFLIEALTYEKWFVVLFNSKFDVKVAQKNHLKFCATFYIPFSDLYRNTFKHQERLGSNIVIDYV